MKSVLLASALTVAALASTAQAQDSAIWEGFYAGAALNSTSLDLTGLFGPFSVGLGNESNFGFFGGYNYAVGSNFVVGGELAYLFEAAYGPTVFLPFPVSVDSTILVRGRGGYATGNVLAYATLGYAWADVSFTGAPISPSAEGVVYGVGLEAMLANQISMRIEYSESQLDLSGTGLPPGVDVDGNTVSMGLAYHF